MTAITGPVDGCEARLWTAQLLAAAGAGVLVEDVDEPESLFVAVALSVDFFSTSAVLDRDRSRPRA